MSENTLTISILVLTTCIALTGFGGKHVRKNPEEQSLPRRVTIRGWVFLFLTAIVLGLSIWKQVRWNTSLSGQIVPNFYSLAEDITGYDKSQWNQYISMRMSLRFLLGKLYKAHAGPQPPESMQAMLAELGRRGILGDDLCRDLDYIRYWTYSVEWGQGNEPTPTQLADVRNKAPSAINALEDLLEKKVRYNPNRASSCGRDPADAPN
jgi:hypothetical protein